MSDDPYADIGARPAAIAAETTGTPPRLLRVAKWVSKGMYDPTFSQDDLEQAVRHAGLSRKVAARWALASLGWKASWEIEAAAAYQMPAAHVVRDDWEEIPPKHRTAAELARTERDPWDLPPNRVPK